jgi:hypothetical protein
MWTIKSVFTDAFRTDGIAATVTSTFKSFNRLVNAGGGK